MTAPTGFVLLHRRDGSKVACRIASVLYVGKSQELGSVLNFGGGSEVNVHEGFDEVVELLSKLSG